MRKDILALFDDWNNAIQSGDPAKVVTLYDKEGVLLPTLSSKVRHNHEEVCDYFKFFLEMGPVGEINEANVRVFDNIAINSGIYTFAFSDGTSARARFTFVYHWSNDHWLIVEHHSSQMPVA